MWTLFSPENFWVFITGAIVCSIIGTAILFRYKNNWLHYVHATLFFSCAALFVSEYLLQQADTYAKYYTPRLLNGLSFYFFMIVGWIITYRYINSLTNWMLGTQVAGVEYFYKSKPKIGRKMEIK